MDDRGFELTVSCSGCFGEIVLDVEALLFCGEGVGIFTVSDDDVVVGDATVSEILSLCRALVAEAKEDDGLASEEAEVGVRVVVAEGCHVSRGMILHRPSLSYIFADIEGGGCVRVL